MKRLYLVSVFFYFLISPLWAKDLIIGTISHAPPFEFQDEKKGLSGFDIDIMNELCKRMDVHCTFKLYDFHRLLNILQQGKVDLAIASIVITPERSQQFLFSLPYKINSLQLVTLATAKYQNYAQLKNKRIGVYKGPIAQLFIAQKLDGQAEVQQYDDVEDLYSALENKEVDAIAVELERAVYWLANTQGFKMIGKPVHIGEGYGIAAPLGQTQLIEQINQQIKNMEQDGTYLKIYKLYF